eukprot:COSAG03_NODE_2592_length_2611_cov_11.720541_3_plen_49_part_00
MSGINTGFAMSSENGFRSATTCPIAVGTETETETATETATATESQDYE